MMEMARERPFAAAAAAAGAAAAGLFLWSRRTQISNQLSNLSDQIGEWTQNMSFGDSGETWSSGDDTAGLTASTSQRTMSETAGGKTSPGRRSGGGGSTGSASSRGRAGSTAATQE
jgi:hypothetical protein